MHSWQPLFPGKKAAYLIISAMRNVGTATLQLGTLFRSDSRPPRREKYSVAVRTDKKIIIIKLEKETPLYLPTAGQKHKNSPLALYTVHTAIHIYMTFTTHNSAENQFSEARKPAAFVPRTACESEGERTHQRAREFFLLFEPTNSLQRLPAASLLYIFNAYISRFSTAWVIPCSARACGFSPPPTLRLAVGPTLLVHALTSGNI